MRFNYNANAIICQFICVVYYSQMRSIINEGSIHMDVIEKIEKLKDERKWTDYELATRAMLTQSTIASMKARKSPPKIDTLQSICSAFGITLSQFFLEDEQIEILTKQEKNLLENFRKLDCEKQNALIDFINK